MSHQQLKFSFTFISLGALLGWYSHIAYNGIPNNINKADTIQIETKNTDVSGVKSVLPGPREENLYIKQFTDFISNKQYDKALSFYQKEDSEKQDKLFSILIVKINELKDHSDNEVLDLLKVFLKEYYNNSQLLMINANVLILKNKKKQALDSFLLAKNYAKDNDEHINISNKIHEFSRLAYKEFEKEKKWPDSIEFFKKLIENEPDFPFYHLCLAKSYINTGDEDMAVTSLQWIKEDVVYREKAMELLDMITLNQLQEGVDLDKTGDQYVTYSILSDFYEVKLLLDTGASYSSLPSYIIAQLVRDNQAEKVGNSKIYTSGGMVDADIYKLKKMTIGSYSVKNIVIVELNLESSQEQESDFEGLLGMNFLSNFDFLIDQQSNKLFLTPKFN